MITRKFRVTVDGETFEVEVEELAGPATGEGARVGRKAAAQRGPEPPPGPPPVPSAPLPAGWPGALAPTGRPPGPARQAPAAASRQGEGKVRSSEAAPGGAERVEAPLPGTVVSVLAAPGTEVKAGQVLLILEAMKMQNEIVSPRDGKVVEVAVDKGDTVALGDLLVLVG
jgi:biotin carboxyl carrier protein